MPDGQAGPEHGFALVDRPRFLARSGARVRGPAKPDCDFAAALLRDLTTDPPCRAADYDARFEALPDHEAAILERALAIELRAGRPRSKPGVPGWLASGGDRLGSLLTGCAHVIAYAVAPIFSTLLNIDALAIARRLRADPALQRKPRDYR